MIGYKVKGIIDALNSKQQREREHRDRDSAVANEGKAISKDKREFKLFPTSNEHALLQTCIRDPISGQSVFSIVVHAGVLKHWLHAPSATVAAASSQYQQVQAGKSDDRTESNAKTSSIHLPMFEILEILASAFERSQGRTDNLNRQRAIVTLSNIVLHQQHILVSNVLRDINAKPTHLYCVVEQDGTVRLYRQQLDGENRRPGGERGTSASRHGASKLLAPVLQVSCRATLVASKHSISRIPSFISSTSAVSLLVAESVSKWALAIVPGLLKTCNAVGTAADGVHCTFKLPANANSLSTHYLLLPSLGELLLEMSEQLHGVLIGKSTSTMPAYTINRVKWHPAHCRQVAGDDEFHCEVKRSLEDKLLWSACLWTQQGLIALEVEGSFNAKEQPPPIDSSMSTSLQELSAIPAVPNEPNLLHTGNHCDEDDDISETVAKLVVATSDYVLDVSVEPESEDGGQRNNFNFACLFISEHTVTADDITAVSASAGCGIVAKAANFDSFIDNSCANPLQSTVNYDVCVIVDIASALMHIELSSGSTAKALTLWLNMLEALSSYCKRIIVVNTEDQGSFVAHGDLAFPARLMSRAMHGALLSAQIEYSGVPMTSLTVRSNDSSSLTSESSNAALLLTAAMREVLQVAVEADVAVVSDRLQQRLVRRYSATEAITGMNALPDASLGNRDGAYIIVGGLGGLGLLTARTLVLLGAKRVVLVSRSGSVAHTGQGLEDILSSLHAQYNNTTSLHRCEVLIRKCDIANESALVELLNEIRALPGGIRGIVHSAGVVRDKLLRGGEAATSCVDLWTSKAQSAWLLHKHTLQDHLDLFLTFSSPTAALGNMGQSAYGATNLFLDELVNMRSQAMELPAISIRWPSVRGVGMAAVTAQSGHLLTDAYSIDPQEVEEILAAVVCHRDALRGQVLTLLPRGLIDGARAATAASTASSGEQQTPVVRQFEEIISSAAAGDDDESVSSYSSSSSGSSEASDGNEDGTGLDELDDQQHRPETIAEEQPAVSNAPHSAQDGITAMDDIDRRVAIAVATLLSKFFGNDNIDMDDHFKNDLGMDSLGAISLGMAIDKEFSIRVRPTFLFDYPSKREVTRYIVHRLHHENSSKHHHHRHHHKPHSVSHEVHKVLASGLWLSYDTDSPADAECDVFVFTAAGQPCNAWHRFATWLSRSQNINVFVLRLPGRFDRSDLRPFPSMGAIAKHAATDIAKIAALTKVPTVLFGHSFGGYVAYETGLALQEMRVNVDHFVSLVGITHERLRAERLYSSHLDEVYPSMELLDEAMVSLFGQTGEKSPAAYQDMNYTKSWLRMLNARASDQPRIKCDFSWIVGRDDKTTSMKYSGWALMFQGDFERIVLNGSHFFDLNDQRLMNECAALIERHLTRKG